ncbi:MAG: polysaccharide deacetylase [Acidimicrobiales bacterium]
MEADDAEQFDTDPPAGSVPMERAAFVVSIDTEMAWGLIHRPERRYRYDDERVHLRRTLAVFDRYAIPATWAVVGHLMLDGCAPVDGIKHPEIVRPDLPWFSGDWFDADPCSTAALAPTWYAPDLIELIRSAGAPHEIASHGFSHIVAGDPGCSRATFDSEIRAAAAAARRHGLTLRSLVHPRNRVGHTDVLVAHGFVAYRGRRAVPAAAGAGRRAVDRLRASERTLVRPRREGPLWNLPATVLFDVDSHPRTWRIWLRQVERRLDQAVEHGALFHLWFHPHNLRARPDIALAALERISRAAAVHRDAGRLTTVTMSGLADQLTAAFADELTGAQVPGGQTDQGTIT